uniref:Tyrosine--tRNA ligase n=1 Tax=uncultured Acidobacteriota bacterium TaxID=171953 RepID=Q7X2X8_9BACT|nr:putative tyrosyl-tRNA synthetase [uncultured Acidobacteriota bacterium]
MDALSEFEWRGTLYDGTEGLREALASGPLRAYAGFDPTAASLHVGSLMPILGLARLQRLGHTPIAVVGGGTGLIGDPSGKTLERQLMDSSKVDEHVAGIRRQLERFLDFGRGPASALLVDNAEWLTSLGAIAFMRDVGKHFTVNYMLAKESVKGRIDREDGISYTEFSYLLLQAYDYLVLHDRHGCALQIGGSDQWGNITAGIELIRRLRGAKAHGLVMPLVTTATGTKFGKTEAGAIWLDPSLTKPYEFYQFWLNTDDRDAVRYLKFFTFLDAARVGELEASSLAEPEKRVAQRELAREVTRLVHGSQAVLDAEAASEKLFRGDVTQMSVDELLQVFANVPSSTVAFSDDGWALADLVTSVGVTKSKGEAQRLVRAGGLYVNERRIGEEKARLTAEDAIGGQVFVIRKGKKDNFLVRISRD